MGGGVLLRELELVRREAYHVAAIYTPTAMASYDVVLRLYQTERALERFLAGGSATEAESELRAGAAEEEAMLTDMGEHAAALNALSETHEAATIARDIGTLRQDFSEYTQAARRLVAAGAGDASAAAELYRRRDVIVGQAERIVALLTRVRNAAADDLESASRRAAIFGAAAFVFILILAAIAATILARRLTAPVEALARAAQRVQGGALDVAVTPAGSLETMRLGEAFNAMMEGLRQKERIKATFGKYLDPRVVEHLTANDSETLRPQAAHMTIGYVNMAGFVRRAESLPPERLVSLLNAFHDAVARPVTARGGVIDKTIGDTLMFIFGAPFSDARAQARQACETALEQAAAVAALAASHPDFAGGSLRAGLATGSVLLGPMGAETSRAYTVIGDAANVADRLERANRVYGTHLLIDGSTHAALGDAVLCRRLDTVILPGKSEPTELFEIAGPHDAPDSLRSFIRAYEAALSAWREGDWAGARSGFETCQVMNPEDGPTALFLQRLDLFVISPPEDWRGVWTLTDRA